MSFSLRDTASGMQIRWIPRYSSLERFLHWGHTFTFIPLILTGIVLFTPALQPLARGDAGLFMRLVHRIAAVFFVGIPIVYALLEPRRLLQTLRDLRFGKDDLDWVKGAFPYYLLGRHVAMPPQSRFNTGEKLNVVVLVTGTVLFAITGAIMWFGRGLIPVELYQACVMLHDLTMIVTVAMFIVHFYLAVVHPMMWQSLVSMRYGYVSESYAREHHAKWFYGEEAAKKMYEEEKAAQAKEAT